MAHWHSAKTQNCVDISMSHEPYSTAEARGTNVLDGPWRTGREVRASHPLASRNCRRAVRLRGYGSGGLDGRNLLPRPARAFLPGCVHRADETGEFLLMEYQRAGQSDDGRGWRNAFARFDYLHVLGAKPRRVAELHLAQVHTPPVALQEKAMDRSGTLAMFVSTHAG